MILQEHRSGSATLALDKHRMCLILDIVLNHIRPVRSLADLQKVKPFNDVSYLHLLNMSGMSFDKQLDDNWKCVTMFCKICVFVLQTKGEMMLDYT